MVAEARCLPMSQEVSQSTRRLYHVVQTTLKDAKENLTENGMLEAVNNRIDARVTENQNCEADKRNITAWNYRANAIRQDEDKEHTDDSGKIFGHFHFPRIPWVCAYLLLDYTETDGYICGSNG